MSYSESLQKIGLKPRESKIYLTLLELKKGSVADLVRQTGLHRPTVYQALSVLQEKGLVTSSPKGKQKVYLPESPKKLKRLVDQLQVEFDDLIPELEETFQTSSKKPIVKYLEGKKGVSFVFDDIVRTLKKGDVYYRYRPAADSKKEDRFIPASYRKMRDEKQLERFWITNEKTKASASKKMDRMVKVIPSDETLFDYNVNMMIYGDKVAYVDFNSETAFIVESPVFACFQKRLFKLLYKKL